MKKSEMIQYRKLSNKNYDDSNTVALNNKKILENLKEYVANSNRRTSVKIQIIRSRRIGSFKFSLILFNI